MLHTPFDMSEDLVRPGFIHIIKNILLKGCVGYHEAGHSNIKTK